MSEKEKWADWLQGIADAVRAGRYGVIKESCPVPQRKQDGKMVYSHHIGIVTETGYHDIRVEATEDAELVR